MHCARWSLGSKHCLDPSFLLSFLLHSSSPSSSFLLVHISLHSMMMVMMMGLLFVHTFSFHVVTTLVGLELMIPFLLMRLELMLHFHVQPNVTFPQDPLLSLSPFPIHVQLSPSHFLPFLLLIPMLLMFSLSSFPVHFHHVQIRP